MQSLVLLDDDPHPLITEYLNGVLGVGVDCEVARWDKFLLDRGRRFNAQLIVAVAVPLADHVLGMFGRLREQPFPTPTLAVLPSEVDNETLVNVSKSADDFVLWPVHKEELRYRVQRLVGSEAQTDDLESAREHLTEIMGMGQLIGTHPDFVRAIKSMPLMAKSDLPLLITGATGTGKELCEKRGRSRSNSMPVIQIERLSPAWHSVPDRAA
jgi:DNA-binding NtrC family response regulator